MIAKAELRCSSQRVLNLMAYPGSPFTAGADDVAKVGGLSEFGVGCGALESGLGMGSEETLGETGTGAACSDVIRVLLAAMPAV